MKNRNHRVTFQSRSTSQDASGGQLTTWSPVATVWAAIAPTSGRERMAAQAVQSDVSHEITVLWQPAFADPKVMAAMRIVYFGNGVTRIFNIAASINHLEANIELTLMCSEGMNNG